MVTEEKIAELEAAAQAEKEKLANEEDSLECMKQICDREAQRICDMNAEWMESVISELMDNMAPFSEDLEKLRKLAVDSDIWPHLDGKERVHLKDQIRECEFEMQHLENKMYDCTRPQLRKFSARLEEEKKRFQSLEQAKRAVDFWEKLYQMFWKDWERRRESWMDERFYQKERQDIRKKMESCAAFTAPIVETVKQRLLEEDRKLFNSVKESLILPEDETLEGTPDEAVDEILVETLVEPLVETLDENLESINDEIYEEMEYYADGFLFLENHLYHCRKAAEKRELMLRERDRLKADMAAR